MNTKRLVFFALMVLVTAFSRIPDKPKDRGAADMNIFLKTGARIDSVFVSNIGQDKLFQFLPYADTLLINSKNTINDFYNINFYSGGKGRTNQLWLNGKNIIIKGRVTEQLVLDVDTVIGSDLYYKSIDFRKRYGKLLERNRQDTATINAFLLSSFERNIDNPFSIEIANIYFLRNVSEKKALRKIYDLQLRQDTTISSEMMSPFKRIGKMLLETRVEFSQIDFHTTNNGLTKLKFSKGKRYLFDFWFVGCAPCVQDHKLISAKLDLLKKNNIEVIGISTDNDQGTWSKYLTTHGYNWLNVREVDDYEKTAQHSMMIGMFPTYVLTDDHGNIADRASSFADLLQRLKLE